MKYAFLLSFLMVFVGCEKDPYPGYGNLRLDRRELNPEKDPPNGVEVPEKIEIVEGETGGFKVKIRVPAPGKPIAWIDEEELEKLPGATYSREDFEFKWTPGMFDGNDPNDQTIKTQQYFLTVRYRSTEDEPNTHQTAKVMVVVIDKPLAFDISGDDSKTVYEGQEMVYRFSVSNKDYPKGPFKVYLDKMPPNVIIKEVDSNNFELRFKPDFLHVKRTDNNQRCGTDKSCMLYDSEVIVTNPAEHKTKKKVAIRVRDVRQPIKLLTPTDINPGLNVGFGVSVVDPNGEEAPFISVVRGRPGAGRGTFKEELTQDEDNNASTLNVSWEDIPLDMNGKKHTFRFKTEVTGSSDTKDFTFKINVKPRQAPVFWRDSWEQNETKYLNFNETYTYNIEITDGDSGIDITDVVVVQEKMRKYVSYSNGTLRVRFDKPGLHQFSLRAKSAYNVASAETFNLEVYPRDRFKTILFTNGTVTDSGDVEPDYKFYTEVLGDVNPINPAIRDLNDRILSGRETLIIGSRILLNPTQKVLDAIDYAMEKIDNVVIATPLLQRMPTTFIDKLVNEFRVGITGRYGQITGAPSLDQMYFVARSDFRRARHKVRIRPKANGEARDPLIFALGVDRKDCEDVMDFTNKDEVQGSSIYKIGVICDRSYPNSGGRLAVLGIDFSNLLPHEDEPKIPAKWLENMLQKSLNNKGTK